ncbi:hypothetical protein Enr13x_03490 [Stieleria neptunia]|uniref:Uncharacterized protein n=1 Tax=Stieleria neptunia TaxID=2527979 RepID=A0A518HIB0_9BACT|nr:hypothetical protein [Stieleria neptunia]QDV40543.1 hypothetical protein Enr13x_03490 [Stieleria neptunia]
MVPPSVQLAKSIHDTLSNAIAVAEQATVGVHNQEGNSHYLSMLLEDRLGRLHQQLLALFRQQDRSPDRTHATNMDPLAKRRRRLIGRVDDAIDLAADTDSSGAVRRSILEDLEGIERDFAAYETEFARVSGDGVDATAAADRNGN